MDNSTHLARTTAAESYGVVGMAGRRLPRLPGRDRLTDCIAVKTSDGGIEADLHVVVEYGLRLAEVAAILRDRVVYEIKEQTGVTVSKVEVRIDDARRS